MINFQNIKIFILLAFIILPNVQSDELRFLSNNVNIINDINVSEDVEVKISNTINEIGYNGKEETDEDRSFSEERLEDSSETSSSENEVIENGHENYYSRNHVNAAFPKVDKKLTFKVKFQDSIDFIYYAGKYFEEDFKKSGNAPSSLYLDFEHLQGDPEKIKGIDTLLLYYKDFINSVSLVNIPQTKAFLNNLEKTLKPLLLHKLVIENTDDFKDQKVNHSELGRLLANNIEDLKVLSLDNISFSQTAVSELLDQVQKTCKEFKCPLSQIYLEDGVIYDNNAHLWASFAAQFRLSSLSIEECTGFTKIGLNGFLKSYLKTMEVKTAHIYKIKHNISLELGSDNIDINKIKMDNDLKKTITEFESKGNTLISTRIDIDVDIDK